MVGGVYSEVEWHVVLLTTFRWWRWCQTHLGLGAVGPGMGAAGFSPPWTTEQRTCPLQQKSLFPLSWPVLLGAIPGMPTKLDACDNQVVVEALRSRSSKDGGAMHLLRCLIFVEAHLGCHLYGQYRNRFHHLADDLSRNCAFSFLSKVPSADPHPTPTSTLKLLLSPQADWVSQQWRRQFGNIFRRD